MVNLDGYNTITPTMVIEENHTYYDWEVGFLPVIPSTIKFSISDVEYEAEEGMTWKEWIESDYNVNNYIIHGNTVMTQSGYFLQKPITETTAEAQEDHHVIEAGVNYLLKSGESEPTGGEIGL